jgi:hypothetical protein
MAAVLQIGTDPTSWQFDPASYDAVAAGLAQPGVPFVVDVFSPIEGRLVLNPLAAGSVALTKPFSSPHWNPNGIMHAKSLAVYVASATGPHTDLPGYALAPGSGHDLPALEQEIIGAMTGKTVLTMNVETRSGDSGVLVLSGATLSYAVICPPKRGVS